MQAMNQILDNDIPVLIMGPTGTGKELVASAIHQNGPRKDKAFVVVNCGAIPENLLESELFGYERGAFTGAFDRHMGKFELANGGILFLDEVGEMPKSLQVKLLRVLQEKEVVRLGGHEKIKLDIKFIYATNKDLKAEVKTGNFREDLYYRVHVFPIQMPALKDRGHDIVLLAEYFLKKMAVELKKPIKGFSLEAEQALLNYDWPGNVRELENVINRAVIVASMERITPADLNLVPLLESAPMNSGVDLQGRAISLDESEKITIQNMLREKKGNLKKTAEALGISRTTLYTKARKFGLM
jgi:transcriptional regulator with PAS, ATPase and Fis domain